MRRCFLVGCNLSCPWYFHCLCFGGFIWRILVQTGLYKSDQETFSRIYKELNNLGKKKKSKIQFKNRPKTQIHIEDTFFNN